MYSIWDFHNDIKQYYKFKIKDLAKILTLKLKNVQKWPKILVVFLRYAKNGQKKSTFEQLIQGHPKQDTVESTNHATKQATK